MLTSGAIRNMYTTSTISGQPMLQVLDLRPIDTNGGQRRYRCEVSDGEHKMAMMLATALNDKVEASEVQTFSIVKLSKASINPVQGRLIVIALELEPISTQAGPVGGKMPIAAHGAFGTGDGGSGGAAAGGGAASAAASASSTSAPSSTSHMATQPIRTLNPYINRWAIKARVTKKGDIRTWSNARGEGKLFSVDLLDDEGGEIRGTFFRDAVDRFHEQLSEGKVYIFSGGRLKIAKKQYSSLDNDYEITFEDRSTVDPVVDDGKIKTFHFSFTDLEQVQIRDPGQSIDVIGVVAEANDASTITTKKGSELTKRDLTIADRTGKSVSLTFWGDQVEKLPPSSSELVGSIVAVKGARIGDFGGRSLSTNRGADVMVNPEIPEASALKAWWESGGSASGLEALTVRGGGGGSGGGGPISVPAKRRTLQWLKDNQDTIANSERGEFVTVKATVVYAMASAERLPWYPSCPNDIEDERNKGQVRKCNKRVSSSFGDESGGSWQCTRCGSIGAPHYRYIYSAVLADFSSSQTVTFFDDTAIELLGGTQAGDLVPLAEKAESGDKDAATALEKKFKEPLWRQSFVTLRCRMENVKDELRLQATVVRMRPVDFEYESARLAEAIDSYF